MNRINFTLIATVKNENAVVSEFIDSILNQSFLASEIIIVDGESTDGTLEKLKEYETKGLIKLFSQRCNIAEGRNLAINHASHNYIAATDFGCKIDRDWLREIKLCFQSPASPDVVAGNFKFDCHSNFEEAVTLATFNPERESTEAAIYYPSSRSIAFKKSAWQEANGYPEWLYAAEDTLFNIRLRQLGFKFIFAQKAVVKWRPRETLRALTKQRFNFSRGNGRVGIGTQGYLINLYYHSLIVILLLLTPLSVFFAIPALFFCFKHVKNNLWPQAKKAEKHSSTKNIKYSVLLVMEHSRLIGLLGFLAGRLDRILDKKYICSQKKWMGVGSLDDL